MFTGIVEATGRIRSVQDRETTRRFLIDAPELAGELGLGDSVAVDGACLTVTRADEEGFAVDVIGTTLDRTIAGRYREGSRVNLERALRLGDRLDGHMVQGHVDGVGTLLRSERDGEFWLLDFRIPGDVAEHTVGRGSIALNGVSLTVAGLEAADVCRIGVIPYTHEHTNLGDLKPGDGVNVEGDLIGKYVRKALSERATPPT